MARKQLSGAQKRKRKREREERQQVERDRELFSWGNVYRSADVIDSQNAAPHQLPIYGVPPPQFLPTVQAAILQLEQGAFYAASYIYDGMMRDDRVSAKCEERIDRLVGAPLTFEPADESDKAEEVAEALEQDWEHMCPAAQLSKLIRLAQGLSVGIAQVLESRTVARWTPRLRVWPNRWLRFDWTAWQFFMVTQNRGEIPIVEGDPEWIIYQPYGPQGWLDSAKIRSLALPWMIRQWSRKWWARYAEVHGQPMRAGVIPSQCTPADERRFLSQLSNLAHEAVFRLPAGTKDMPGFDVKLIEATAKSWEAFQQLLQHCDDSIAIVYLGQSQSTKGQGGLGSQENAGESTILRLTRKDALVGNVLREQLIKRWADVNFGDPELAPHLKWEIDPPEDREKNAKVDELTSKALVSFKEAGAPIDVRVYLQERGYPLIEQAEEDETPDDTTDETVAPDGGPDGAPPTEGAQEGDVPEGDATGSAVLALTPTHIAAIVKVNEGRKSLGLPLIEGEIGNLWIQEQASKIAAQAPIATQEDVFGGHAPDGGAPPPGDSEPPSPEDVPDEQPETEEETDETEEGGDQ